MTRRFLSVALSFLLFTLLATATKAQFLLVRITDENNVVITAGESLLVGFIGQSEITSFGQESSSCTATTPSCVPVTGNFVYNMRMDATITDYRKALYLHKLWKKVEISFTENTANSQLFVYYKITLQDVYVTDILNATTSGDPSNVQIKLDPAKISWAYTPLNSVGNPGTTKTFNWDRNLNATF